LRLLAAAESKTVPNVSGGEKLAAALTRMSRQLARPAALRVGFLEGATYPDGKSVAMIAAIQEYGAPRARMPRWLIRQALAKMAPEERKAFQAGSGGGGRGIPPRPYFRPMVAAKSPGWSPALAAALRATGNKAEPALRLVGEHIRGQLQQSIRDTDTPPLSPLTIALKGFAKPLISTSHMISSVDYEVKITGR